MNGYRCYICSRSLTTVGTLNRHLSHVHGIGGSPKLYICNICGQEFKRADHLPRHVLAVHSEEKQDKVKIKRRKRRVETTEVSTKIPCYSPNTTTNSDKLIPNIHSTHVQTQQEIMGQQWADPDLYSSPRSISQLIPAAHSNSNVGTSADTVPYVQSTVDQQQSTLPYSNAFDPPLADNSALDPSSTYTYIFDPHPTATWTLEPSHGHTGYSNPPLEDQWTFDPLNGQYIFKDPEPYHFTGWHPEPNSQALTNSTSMHVRDALHTLNCTEPTSFNTRPGLHTPVVLPPEQIPLPAASLDRDAPVGLPPDLKSIKLQPLDLPAHADPLEIPWSDPVVFSSELVGPFDNDVENIFKAHWGKIRTFEKNDIAKKTYNFRLPMLILPSVYEKLLKRVHEKQSGVYKLNYGFGIILRHKVTGQLSYSYPEKNSLVLSAPTMIASEVDLGKALEGIKEVDPQEYTSRFRPSTENEFWTLTNLTMYVYPMAKQPVGANQFEDNEHEQPLDNITQEEEILRFIKRSKSILSFEKNSKGYRYTDRLCFFRCLASELLEQTHVREKAVIDLYHQWYTWCRNRQIQCQTIDEFPGVDIFKDISNLEDCFEVNVFVYTLRYTTSPDYDTGDIYEILAQEEINRDMSINDSEEVGPESGITAQIIVRSMKLYSRNLYLNMNFDHFSRITKIQSYVRYWTCEVCGKLIERKDKYMEHRKVCTGTMRKKYTGGGYGNRLTIFEKLADEGLHIADDDRFYPYRIVFDFECRFQQLHAVATATITYEKKLIPISVSIASNVPEFSEPKCIVEEDPKNLVRQFLNYLECISNKASEILAPRYQHITNQIKVKTNEMKTKRTELNNLRRQKGDASRIEALENYISENGVWIYLEKQWDRWLNQIPVVGFNSAKFDLNLVKTYLIPLWFRDDVAINCIKRGSAYLLLTAGSLMFVDVTNFLAQGTSYANWLSGFGVEEKKGLFPYEWLTDFSLLEKQELPPIDAFFSSLKQSGISNQEYQDLQDIWVENKFQTMKDLLVWYNNKDVGPFLEALNKMCSIFGEMQIDMLKSGCISLPGLAQVRMFQDIRPDVIFQLYDEGNKDYRDLVHKNIVGGPAIIFKRRAIAGKDKIKGTGPTTGSVVGYDANGLYSWSLAQEMPTGIGVTWEPLSDLHHAIPANVGSQSKDECIAKIKENELMRYKRKLSTRGFEELIVVNLIYNDLVQWHGDKHLSLRHRFNGKQKMFLFGKQRVPVDGWIPEIQTIIQYHGCFYHGHNCHLTKSADQRQLKEKLEATKKIGDKLRSTGCELIEIWQCDFYHQKNTDQHTAEYARKFEAWGHRKSDITMKRMIEEILNGSFFGMVEVDIQVPFWDQNLRKKMAEFPPVFKNIEVSIDDIGQHMQDFARKEELMKRPRRALIGSYFAEKMLIATPLLRWYMEHGLIITRIYKALQYVPYRAFEHLPQEVAEHRRRADDDPTLAAYGLLFKLMGNSYYGKCLTDKEKHVDIEYQNRKKAAQSVCNPRFRDLDVIEEGIYEVKVAKGQVTFDLPINIAYFVYANAKLRMLQFYYDFLIKVLPNHSFELLEMDTDSFYFAIAGTTLEDSVPNHLRNEYEHLKHDYLVCNNYDKKTPGLFKLEWSGKGMVSLCPKTYIAFSDNDDNLKISTKGLGKRTNKLSVEDFQRVLHNKQTVGGVNRGFTFRGGHLNQYKQHRKGLSYLYIKRKVRDNGVDTTPLDI